ncbi:MAG: HDOD domain-containing protein [Leptospiraceae bacterium]|nr:HDOD domain-containing protein [Leptospiraceae bacterium]
MIPTTETYDKIIQGKEFSIRQKYISEEGLRDFYNIFLLVLSYFDQQFLVEIAFTISKEIWINAIKANAKRLFFQRQNLDILNPNHYQKGMEQFSEEVTMKWHEQEAFLNKAEFYIETRIKLQNESLLITVENNAGVLPEEQERINARIEASQKYNDLSEAFADMLDSSESAGLGLILTQILLKNSGIGKENFSMKFDPDKTLVKLSIPRTAVPVTPNTKFNAKILDEIQNLPPMPQRITKLLELCNKPDTEISLISLEVEKDPGLSADLLRLSNSTFFVTRNKATTVTSAIKIVGLKNLKNMLYVTGVNKILQSKYKKAEEVWAHSEKCSFFAKMICLDAGKTKLADIASTCGLLHDIGKLIILSIDGQIAFKIENLKDKEKNNSVILEEFTVGASHASVGSMLLSKWNFPEELIAAVEYHHKPFLAEPQHKELVEIIYLANMMIDVLDHKASFFVINEPILKTFKIDNEKSFNNYLERLNKQYIATK